MAIVQEKFNAQLEAETVPALPNRAGVYFVKKDGHLYFNEKNKKTGEMETVKLANFRPVPLRELILDNGQDIERFFELEAIVNGTQTLPAVKIPAKDFSSLSWVHNNWGWRANIEPGYGMKDKMRHAIQMFAENVPEQKVFTHLGWREIEGQWTYLHAGGSIGANAEIELESKELKNYKLPDQEQDVLETIETSFNLLKLADSRITFPLLALVGLAPLCQAAKNGLGTEPDFLLYLNGRSGSRKSTVAALMLNHFGFFPSTNSLPASFDGTANSIEKLGFYTKDTILVVDDYYPTENRSKKENMDRVAQLLQRTYGNRAARSRLNADTSLKQSYPPRGLCLATGEDMPGGSESGAARMFVIELDKKSIDNSLLTQLNIKAKDFSNNMRAYIQWLAPQMNDLGEEIRIRFNELREKATREDHHGRITSSVVWLTIGLEYFTKFAKEIGFISNQEQKEILVTGWKAFLANAQSQSDQMAGDKPTTMFLEAVNEMLNTDKIRTKHREHLDPSGFGELVGYHDSEYYYFHPKSIYNHVCGFYKAQGKTFPLTQLQLYKQLESENHIYTKINKKGEKERTVNKTIGGKQIRYLHVKKNSIEQNTEE